MLRHRHFLQIALATAVAISVFDVPSPSYAQGRGGSDQQAPKSSADPTSTLESLRGKFEKLHGLRSEFEAKAKEFTTTDRSIADRDAAAGSYFDEFVGELRDLISYTSPTGQFAQTSQQVVQSIDAKISNLKKQRASENAIADLQLDRQKFVEASTKTIALNSALAEKLREVLLFEQEIRKAIRADVSIGDLTGLVNRMNAILEQIIQETGQLIMFVRPRS